MIGRILSVRRICRPGTTSGHHEPRLAQLVASAGGDRGADRTRAPRSPAVALTVPGKEPPGNVVARVDRVLADTGHGHLGDGVRSRRPRPAWLLRRGDGRCRRHRRNTRRGSRPRGRWSLWVRRTELRHPDCGSAQGHREQHDGDSEEHDADRGQPHQRLAARGSGAPTATRRRHEGQHCGVVGARDTCPRRRPRGRVAGLPLGVPAPSASARHPGHRAIEPDPTCARSPGRHPDLVHPTSLRPRAVPAAGQRMDEPLLSGRPDRCVEQARFPTVERGEPVGTPIGAAGRRGPSPICAAQVDVRRRRAEATGKGGSR
jgi:hypothetical protein